MFGNNQQPLNQPQQAIQGNFIKPQNNTYFAMQGNNVKADNYLKQTMQENNFYPQDCNPQAMQGQILQASDQRQQATKIQGNNVQFLNPSQEIKRNNLQTQNVYQQQQGNNFQPLNYTQQPMSRNEFQAQNYRQQTMNGDNFQFQNFPQQMQGIKFQAQNYSQQTIQENIIQPSKQTQQAMQGNNFQPQNPTQQFNSPQIKFNTITYIIETDSVIQNVQQPQMNNVENYQPQININNRLQSQPFLNTEKIANLLRQLRERVQIRANLDFMGEITSKEQFLIDEFPHASNQKIHEYQKYLSGLKQIIKVRGDGNCFYTSIFFGIITFYFSQNKFQQLETIIQQIEVPQLIFQGIQYNYSNFNEHDKMQMKIYIINQLRNVKNLSQFQNLFKIDYPYFYESFVILSRSLVYNCCQKEREQLSIIAEDFNLEEILKWEEESPNYTEYIIYILVNFLKISIDFFSIDQPMRNYIPLEGNSIGKISLLYTKGHYGVVL